MKCVITTLLLSVEVFGDGAGKKVIRKVQEKVLGLGQKNQKLKCSQLT